MTQTPRKRIRHFDESRQVHELTFSCLNQRPLLTNPQWCGMLSTAIERATQKHGFSLLAFIYMPEHVHLAVHPHGPDSRVDALLYAIKRPFSYRIKRELQATQSPLLQELTVPETNGASNFHFWRPGPGYDRNLWGLKDLKRVLDYVHNNPVRRGLCVRPGDWLWSSFHAYAGEAPAGVILPPVSMIDCGG